MKKKVSSWFILGLVCWLVILLLRKKGIFIPVISNHLTDFMTIPMYTCLIEYIMNVLLNYSWKPDFKFILSSTVYLSLLFEAVCPMLSDNFTGDFLDVVAYFTGGMVYYFVRIGLPDFFKSDRV
ncbi:hypothetical protein JET18_02760 [Chryseobacterium sp. L7]|uniref:VanZ-like domain-containing protein n=1 Tax=Chryseobacterium endalhagicum TaxID=2797638 RepID=A0ABS1QAU7_9FLAO|nr:hypothetical protein [Chryseobacterium endalhagicum]MBL1219739.1 hypothetical protein [Chryseobacterium endalhagicum]